jgi:hypothetical protein
MVAKYITYDNAFEISTSKYLAFIWLFYKYIKVLTFICHSYNSQNFNVYCNTNVTQANKCYTKKLV